MNIVPKEKPIISNLNTYYIDIAKLIEHCQGEAGAGGIFFASPSAQAVIFFDQEEILNGYFRDKEEELTGDTAVSRLIESGANYNFTVNIYAISIGEVYFWSSLPSAERIYKDLSTEFTDLDGLIKKMSAEKLTGFIDVSIANGSEGGLVFLSNGEIVGGSFTWAQDQPAGTKANIDQLIEKTKTSAGLFQVSRIPVNNGANESVITADTGGQSPRALTMVEEIMGIFETLFTTKKFKNTDLNSLIKKKFIEKAERFAFLDPFAAEFEYKNRKVLYSGNAEDKELLIGIVTSLKELAADLDIIDEFRTYLIPWHSKYENQLKTLDIAI